MTVYESKGHGHQKGHSEIYGAVEYVAYFIPKLCIEVIVTPELVTSVVRAIMLAARTGKAATARYM